MEGRKKKIDGYTILLDKKLGEGAFGKVYIGEQDNTGRKVAIKMLDKKSIDADDYMKSALFSEIQILKSVKSPNIVGFFDVMESSNYYYICQEFCDGGDLRGMLTKRGRIPESEAVHMLTQICAGFLELIKEGIVHRDMKPENILINQSNLKLADFGFSKRTSNQRVKNQTMVGTPLYMSLEILKSEPYSSKCDIWAVGFIYYQILYGRTPWTGNTEYELIKNIETKPLEFGGNVSAVSADFLRNCLALKEEKRWSWDQLLRHQIFNNAFSSQLSYEQQFENKLKQLMGSIRFQIQSQNIDLERIFAKSGFNKNSELRFEHFERFIKTIDSTISKQQQRFIFEKLDTDDSNTISFAELEGALQRFGVPMRSRGVEVFKNIQNHGLDDQRKKQIETKIAMLFQKLASQLDNRNLTIKDIFNTFDFNKTGTLGLTELGRILGGLDRTLTREELVLVFKLIDTDNSGEVSYDEFLKFFCRATGTPAQNYFYRHADSNSSNGSNHNQMIEQVVYDNNNNSPSPPPPNMHQSGPQDLIFNAMGKMFGIGSNQPGHVAMQQQQPSPPAMNVGYGGPGFNNNNFNNPYQGNPNPYSSTPFGGQPVCYGNNCDTNSWPNPQFNNNPYNNNPNVNPYNNNPNNPFGNQQQQFNNNNPYQQNQYPGFNNNNSYHSNNGW